MKTLKKAGVPTPAQNYKQHNSKYTKTVSLSSLKMQIGENLLSLLTENELPGGWGQFERLLRQFYERGIS